MSTFVAAAWQRVNSGARGVSRPGFTLAAAVLGFFVITLDPVIVNVALPSIQRDLGGGMTGLQWVVDGYTLMFAAPLLSAGALSDRVGARRAFAAGLTVFVVASAAFGVAYTVTGSADGRLLHVRSGRGARGGSGRHRCVLTRAWVRGERLGVGVRFLRGGPRCEQAQGLLGR